MRRNGFPKTTDLGVRGSTPLGRANFSRSAATPPPGYATAKGRIRRLRECLPRGEAISSGWLGTQKHRVALTQYGTPQHEEPCGGNLAGPRSHVRPTARYR